jgi:hypothetical protein
MQHAGDILMAIGQQERALLKKVEQTTYVLYEQLHEYQRMLEKEKKKMEMAAIDDLNTKLKGPPKDANMEVSHHFYCITIFFLYYLFLGASFIGNPYVRDAERSGRSDGERIARTSRQTTSSC